MRVLLPSIALVLGPSVAANAALIQYEISGLITSSPLSPDWVTGDGYTIRLTIDSDSTLTALQPGVFRFEGAVKNFSFALSEDAAGTYQGGTFAAADLYLYDEFSASSASFDLVGFSPQSTAPDFSFPSIGIKNLVNLEFSLVPLSNQMIGPSGAPLPALNMTDFDLSSAYSGVRFAFSDDPNPASWQIVYADISTIQSTAIPEPVTCAWFMSISVFIWAGHRRRRN